MAGETIELLKNYDPAKMHWPAMHQQKIDGVPVRIVRQSGDVRSYTRQGERVTSIPHIERLCSVLLQNGESVIMELCIPDQTFKYISGKVRQIKPCPELRGWVFDFTTVTEQAWWTRRLTCKHRLEDTARIAGCSVEDLLIQLIPGSVVYDAEEAEEAHSALMLANPDAEGSVLHGMNKPFQPGKRCWGTQRMKPVPTIDLMVVGFEEAISENGTPLKMVGRINAEFTKFVDVAQGLAPITEIIGIGPGALTHTERKLLWAEYKAENYKPRIAEIRYMRDDSYDALRQPTFKQWRDDKQKADTHAG